MAKKFYFGSNTKRDLSRDRHIEMLTAAIGLAKSFDEVQFFILPPAPLFGELKARSNGTSIWLGSQSITGTSGRNQTGEVSGQLLAELGSDLILIGHAERRAMGEDGEIASAQFKNAAESGLQTLICIGESKVSTASERTEKYQEQLQIIAGAKLKNILIAYEPVFAIGEGSTPADPIYVAESIDLIRKVLQSLAAKELPILYGGSVNSESAAGYAAICDGLFVGRSAWSAEGFTEVFKATQK